MLKYVDGCYKLILYMTLVLLAKFFAALFSNFIKICARAVICVMEAVWFMLGIMELLV